MFMIPPPQIRCGICIWLNMQCIVYSTIISILNNLKLLQILYISLLEQKNALTDSEAKHSVEGKTKSVNDAKNIGEADDAHQNEKVSIYILNI